MRERCILMRVGGAGFAIVMLLMIGQGALAQQAQAAENNSDLAKQVQNPVADLISVPFQNNFNFGNGHHDRIRYNHLSADEREAVSLGLAHGHSLRAMARVLGRAPSTVSREVARNTPRGGPYRACAAQRHAAVRPRPAPAASTETPRPVVVAVCSDAAGGGLVARADCGTPPPGVS
jgi:hypothetical protein